MRDEGELTHDASRLVAIQHITALRAGTLERALGVGAHVTAAAVIGVALINICIGIDMMSLVKTPPYTVMVTM